MYIYIYIYIYAYTHTCTCVCIYIYIYIYIHILTYVLDCYNCLFVLDCWISALMCWIAITNIFVFASSEPLVLVPVSFTTHSRCRVLDRT